MITTTHRKRTCEDDREAVVRGVEERLKRRGYPLLRTISFEYERGMLILRGRLPSYYHKQLAQEAARAVQGVARVVNEIEVTPPGSP